MIHKDLWRDIRLNLMALATEPSNSTTQSHTEANSNNRTIANSEKLQRYRLLREAMIRQNREEIEGPAPKIEEKNTPARSPTTDNNSAPPNNTNHSGEKQPDTDTNSKPSNSSLDSSKHEIESVDSGVFFAESSSQETAPSKSTDHGQQEVAAGGSQIQVIANTTDAQSNDASDVAIIPTKFSLPADMHPGSDKIENSNSFSSSNSQLVDNLDNSSVSSSSTPYIDNQQYKNDEPTTNTTTNTPQTGNQLIDGWKKLPAPAKLVIKGAGVLGCMGIGAAVIPAAPIFGAFLAIAGIYAVYKVFKNKQQNHSLSHAIPPDAKNFMTNEPSYNNRFGNDPDGLANHLFYIMNELRIPPEDRNKILGDFGKFDFNSNGDTHNNNAAAAHLKNTIDNSSISTKYKDAISHYFSKANG